MAARGSKIAWFMTAIFVLAVVAILFFLPSLIRKGATVIGPFMDLQETKSALLELDSEFPFEPPADGLVTEARLKDFLDVRTHLKQLFESLNVTQ